MICGYCGNPVSAETGTARNGEAVRYYRCHGIKRYRTDCELKMVRKDVLEEQIVDAIMNELSKKTTMDDMVAELLKKQDRQIVANAKIATLKREKAKVDKSLENLVMALEQGIMSATTNKRLHEPEKQQAEPERDILIEESKEITKIPESVIREFYAEALKQEAELMVNLLVRQNVLYNDRIEIQLNTPMKNGPDTDERGRPFCIRHAEVRYATYHKGMPEAVSMRIEMFV